MVIERIDPEESSVEEATETPMVDLTEVEQLGWALGKFFGFFMRGFTYSQEAQIVNDNGNESNGGD